MLGVVALIMLVACANLAGLSLARGAAREHELAVSAALGSGRWRLMRQSLVESLMLALFGAGLGVLVAVWARAGFARLLAGSTGDLRYAFSLDATVLGFASLAALAAALLSGLLPALRAGWIDPVNGLKSRGTIGLPRLRAGRILVAAQLGISLVLVAGAGLYVRTLVNLARIDAGFDVERLLLFRLNIRGAGQATADPAGFYARVQESLAAIPGVRAASLVEFPLLSGAGSSGIFSAFSGRSATAGTSVETCRLTVGETFFSTLGIPIVHGRGFSPTDAEGAPKVVVVNEAFVRKYLPDENPLGLMIPVWDADWQIVGVCRDVKYSTLKQESPPTAYFPFRQRLYSRFRHSHLRAPYFTVRASLPPLSLATAVRKAVAANDSEVAVTDLTTQDAVRDRSIGQERLFAVLCGSLAGLALLLSCIGLYGLMAYHVTRRTGEIAIRMALGATRSRIAGPILRETLLLAVVGIGLGLPVALAATRLIRSQMYGVEPNDPLTIIVSALVLAVVTMMAAWLPARRAARIDPMAALRQE
jgi:predicted permease